MLAAMRVLVAEDEKKLAGFIRKGLEEHGFAVTVCHNGDDAYTLLQVQPFDLVVLDIMLPGRDGLSILKNLRERKNTVPVILVTARSEANERVEGLNLGADDYTAKPFYMDELLARVQAVLRLHFGRSTQRLARGRPDGQSHHPRGHARKAWATGEDRSRCCGPSDSRLDC
jgi:DNA-binding response OmpR family regulator